MSMTEPPTRSIELRSSSAPRTAFIVNALRPIEVNVLSWTHRPETQSWVEPLAA